MTTSMRDAATPVQRRAPPDEPPAGHHGRTAPELGGAALDGRFALPGGQAKATPRGYSRTDSLTGACL
jgi:hypothetical protein